MNDRQVTRFCELLGQGHPIIVAAQISTDEHPSAGEIEPPSTEAIALIDEAIRRVREKAEKPSEDYLIARFTGRSTASLLAKINPDGKEYQNAIESVNHLKLSIKEAHSALTAINQFTCGTTGAETEIFGFILDDLAPEIQALVEERERLSITLEARAEWAGLSPEEKRRRAWS